MSTVIDQLWDLEYADDTISFGRSLNFLQAALTGLREESELYGLFLNMTKCAVMAYEQKQTRGAPERRLKFTNGQVVKTTERETY